MSETLLLNSAELGATASDWVSLLKPRVMSLVVFTGAIGLVVAPVHMNPILAVTAILCIAVGAGAAGAINMWYDRDIDAIMKRTAMRPVAAGRIEPGSALGFGVVLAIGSVLLMAVVANVVAAGVLAGSIAFYVFIYTMWLKRRTPQNIVIGGAAGRFSGGHRLGGGDRKYRRCCRCCCLPSCFSGRRRISGRSRCMPPMIISAPGCRCCR